MHPPYRLIFYGHAYAACTSFFRSGGENIKIIEISSFFSIVPKRTQDKVVYIYISTLNKRDTSATQKLPSAVNLDHSCASKPWI